MSKKIEKIKKARLFLLEQIALLTDEQLNKIPDGYNNNIIWNIAHLICAQQAICYLRAGQPVAAPDKFIAPFSTNTKPGSVIDKQDIQEIKSLFISTIDQLHLDYDKQLFSNYAPSPNILKIYKIELSSIDDALEFILYHEGYHSGYIISLIKLVS